MFILFAVLRAGRTSGGTVFTFVRCARTDSSLVAVRTEGLNWKSMETMFTAARRIKDNCQTSLTILFVAVLFLYPAIGAGQPGKISPDVRVIDRQVVTANGGLLLLYSRLCEHGYRKGIPLEYALLSKEGTIRKDTSIYLVWPREFNDYDCYACRARYYGMSDTDHAYNSANSREWSGPACARYLFYSQDGKTVIGYFLGGDRKFAYEIVIDDSGRSEWAVYDLDTLDGQAGSSAGPKYANDTAKFAYWGSHLRKKWDKLISLPQKQTDYSASKKRYKSKALIFLSSRKDQTLTNNF